MKNYYAILGVHHDAELIVIKAAYRAMVKKYHPDTFEGDKAEAEEKIRDITEAYETLSNAEKRKHYDSEFAEQSGHDDFGDYQRNEFYEDNSQVNEDWAVIIEVHPEAELARRDLAKLSKKLALVFQSVLIEGKLSHKSADTAKVMEAQFLKTYFGPHKKLQNLAKEALMQNRQDLAKEINKKVVLLGGGSSDQIYQLYIDRVRASAARQGSNTGYSAPYEKEYRGYFYVEQSQMLQLIRQPVADTLSPVNGLQYSNINQLKFFVDQRINELQKKAGR